MKLEDANFICPKCGNANYMRYLIGKNIGEFNVKCINCNNYFKAEDLRNEKKKITHGDEVRKMNDDELVDWYIWIYKQLPHYTNSFQWLREYLKQEVNNDEWR